MSLLKGPVPPVVLAVGIAAAYAGGIYALVGPHTAKAAAPIRNAVWTVDARPDAPIANGLAGVWETPDVVVRSGLDGMHAVHRGDGTAAWDLAVPKAGGAVCSLSAATDAGIGVFSYSADPSGRPCGAYSGVDLKTGKVLWTGTGADVQEIAVDSGMAVVRDGSGVAGLDLRTGTAKWKHGGSSSSCTSGPGLLVADHGRVATAQDCAADHVLVLDVKTGATVSSAPGFSAVTEMGGVSADPLIVGDGTDKTLALAFGAVQTRLADPLTGAYPTVGDQVQSRANVALGGGVLCAGGQAALCFTTAGKPITLRPLPGAAAARHDVIPVDSLNSDAARVLTVRNDKAPRTELCRVNADGTYIVEAELSLAVSQFLGMQGSAAAVFAVSDGKDLVLVAQHPDGDTAIVDVRLVG